MEKRKWLWKRKSSEKSSGETESSGSNSSHSERYSDDHRVEAVNTGSPEPLSPKEVSSKGVMRTEVGDDDESCLKIQDVNDSMKILMERLSAALVNVSAKEELVKQHAKVAEDAVAGWEKADAEVAILRQQLESAAQQRSALEDRVSHLDGALKECVRQLRQSRDEQEQKIHEAVSLRTLEWESTKCIFESKLVELQHKAELSARVGPEICHKLEFLERENSALRLEIHDQMEELEVRTIERDLSTQAAETASKQHLESIKKVAKLEAECRRLKATVSKSYTTSTDSHSDNGDRLNSVETKRDRLSPLIVNKSLTNSSVEINLMDDFLEMEQLAATESRSVSSESESKCRESVLRDELDAMIHKTAELEEKLARLESEKVQWECCESKNESNVLIEELGVRMQQTTELEERLKNLEREKAELENESELVENVLRTELETTIRRSIELERMLEKLEMEKEELERDSKSVESVLRSELEAMIHRTSELEEKLEKLENEKIELENKLKNREISLRAELEAMINRTAALEENLEKFETERVYLEQKLGNLETEKSELEEKLEKLEIEKAELETSESKRGEAVLRAELAAIHQTAELEEKLEKLKEEKIELETALSKSRECTDASELQFMEAELKWEVLHREWSAARESKRTIESRLVSVEEESRSMSAKVSLLEEEVQRERALSDEIAVKCRELEDELSAIEKEEESKQDHHGNSNPEKRIKQEDLAVAAGKLAECQKTIASLGNQLKSLATLEDFLMDAANLPEVLTGGAKLNLRTGEPWKLHSNQTFSPKRDLASKIGDRRSPSLVHTLSKIDGNASPPSAPSPLSSSAPSSTSVMVVSSNVGSEKNRNGFAKFFSRTKSGIRLEI